jgi:hypothetical protein
LQTSIYCDRQLHATTSDRNKHLVIPATFSARSVDCDTFCTTFNPGLNPVGRTEDAQSTGLRHLRAPTADFLQQ